LSSEYVQGGSEYVQGGTAGLFGGGGAQSADVSSAISAKTTLAPAEASVLLGSSTAGTFSTAAVQAGGLFSQAPFSEAPAQARKGGASSWF
jgi:hypothetical protein